MRASFLELMLSLLSKTSRRNQSDFNRNLQTKYGFQKVEKSTWVWSVVKRRYVNKDDQRAAHLFPLCFGQDTMNYIFGEKFKGEMNMAQNGLFLPHDVERAFDRHQVIIVPYKQETTPQEWQFLVLDRGGLWKTSLSILGQGCTFADLHGRQLLFELNHSFRPRVRFLYFHYVLTILRLKRDE